MGRSHTCSEMNSMNVVLALPASEVTNGNINAIFAMNYCVKDVLLDAMPTASNCCAQSTLGSACTARQDRATSAVIAL